MKVGRKYVGESLRSSLVKSSGEPQICVVKISMNDIYKIKNVSFSLYIFNFFLDFQNFQKL